RYSVSPTTRRVYTSAVSSAAAPPRSHDPSAARLVLARPAPTDATILRSAPVSWPAYSRPASSGPMAPRYAAADRTPAAHAVEWARSGHGRRSTGTCARSGLGRRDLLRAAGHLGLEGRNCLSRAACRALGARCTPPSPL